MEDGFTTIVNSGFANDFSAADETIEEYIGRCVDLIGEFEYRDLEIEETVLDSWPAYNLTWLEVKTRIPATGTPCWSRQTVILIFTPLTQRQIMRGRCAIPGMTSLTVSHLIFPLSEAAKIFTLWIAILTRFQRMVINQKIQEVFL